MKVNPKYILREIAGQTVLVSLQDISAPKSLICLNETGKQIFLMLQEGCSREEILAELLRQYPSAEQELSADLEDFLSELRDRNVLLPE